VPSLRDCSVSHSYHAFTCGAITFRAQKAISPANILDLHKVSDIQLSPDGKLAAIFPNLPGNGALDEGLVRGSVNIYDE
jgi:hypothetical protein